MFHPQKKPIAHTPNCCKIFVQGKQIPAPEKPPKFIHEIQQRYLLSTPQPKPDRIRLLPVALSTLLALDALTSTLGGVGGVLGLVSLLLALGSGLLLLALLDGLLAGGGTGLGALGAALLDNVEGGTDNGTLGLHDTAGTLLGNFLFS